LSYCQYEHEPSNFKCRNEALESGFCEFHDDKYYLEHPKEISKKFHELVDEEQKNPSKYFRCIGYHIVDCNFSNKTFKQNVVFNQSEFSGKTNFTWTTFSKEASFEDVTFSGKVSFSAAKFLGLAYFQNTKFSEQAAFSGTRFLEDVGFIGAEFSGAVYFGGTKFSKVANFLNTKFSGLVFFDIAEFSGEAEFIGTKFYGETNFASTKFSKVGFKWTKFSREAWFRGAVFSGETDFTWTKFSGEADFKEAKFYGIVVFSETKFAEVNFRESLFHKEVNFSGAIFGREVYLGGAKFLQGSNFRRALFEKPEGVIFEGDLSSFSFYQTDISRTRFDAGVKWQKADDSDKLEKQFKVKEEREIEDALKNSTSIDTDVLKLRLEDIIGIYRNLKDNYEYYARYNDAGQFFIREMEMKRNYKEEKSGGKIIIKKRNWFARNFFATGLYHLTSNYGEGYERPIIFTTGAMIGSTLFFYFSGNETNLFDAFERTARALSPTLSLPEPISDSTNSEKPLTAVDYLLKVVIVPIAVTLFIAFRRKLERKFRH